MDKSDLQSVQACIILNIWNYFWLFLTQFLLTSNPPFVNDLEFDIFQYCRVRRSSSFSLPRSSPRVAVLPGTLRYWNFIHRNPLKLKWVDTDILTSVAMISLYFEPRIETNEETFLNVFLTKFNASRLNYIGESMVLLMVQDRQLKCNLTALFQQNDKLDWVCSETSCSVVIFVNETIKFIQWLKPIDGSKDF